MPEITVTLHQILDAQPCYDPRYRGLLPSDHDLDAPISFREIAAKAGPYDTIWCFSSALPGHESLKRHFAVDCAERVRHLMTDERSLNALAGARRHAMGLATDEELIAARNAARNAALDARAAAKAAAKAAAWSTRDAESSARDAKNAAGDASRVEELEWQVARLVQLAEAGEWAPEAP